jgi:pimeloyl-ACP methyl ester carboxylesterase
VLLLLHGLGATSGVWNGFMSAAGLSCVTPDLPGHGRSAPQPE